MIHRLALLAVLTCALVPRMLWAQSAVVLVASSQSPIVHVTAPEIRHIYLGIPLLIDGKKVKPLRNGTDPKATEMFMQRVMYMSSDAYERQIRRRISESQESGPPLLDDEQELLLALSSDPMAVTYMMRSQAIGGLPLRIVGEM
jgi:hypothetical protein